MYSVLQSFLHGLRKFYLFQLLFGLRSIVKVLDCDWTRGYLRWRADDRVKCHSFSLIFLLQTCALAKP